jgi:hypothetical protein
MALLEKLKRIALRPFDRGDHTLEGSAASRTPTPSQRQAAGRATRT